MVITIGLLLEPLAVIVRFATLKKIILLTTTGTSNTSEQMTYDLNDL